MVQKRSQKTGDDSLGENVLTTKQVKEFLKISDCEVMHLRLSGRVAYKKKGNAFLYYLSDIQKEHQKRNK